MHHKIFQALHILLGQLKILPLKNSFCFFPELEKMILWQNKAFEYDNSVFSNNPQE